MRVQRGPATVTGNGPRTPPLELRSGKARGPARAGSQETDPGRSTQSFGGRKGGFAQLRARRSHLDARLAAPARDQTDPDHQDAVSGGDAMIARGNVLLACTVVASGLAIVPWCAWAETERAASDPATDGRATSVSLPIALAADTTPLRPVSRPDSTLGYVAPVKEVRGRRLSREEILDRSPGFATVLDESSWSGGMISAADVLADAVGVTVRDTGGLGRTSTASIRGSTSAQVPIYLDGVPLNSPERGAVDLASIDLNSLERVEIYRGAAPLTLGGGSMGGAIHLFSARGITPLRVELGAGSYGGYEGELGGSALAGDWILAFRARGYRNAGDWSFFSDRGTPYNPADDRRIPRVNNEARGAGGLLSAQRALGPWSLRVSQLLDLREQGRPGLGYLQSENAESGAVTSQTRVALRSVAGGKERIGEGWLRSVEAYHRLEQQSFDDREGHLGGTPTARRDRVHALGLAATGGLRGAEQLRLEARWARWRSRDEIQRDGEGDPQTRTTLAAAWQPRLTYFGERLLVSPGARVEWHHDRFHGTPAYGSLPHGPSATKQTVAPTAQLGLRLSVARDLDLKADVGSYRRVPTLFELFGNRGSVMGRADLRPENGTNRDLGLVWSRPEEGRRLAMAFFWNDVFDLITYEPVSASTTRAANLGRAELRGLELDADLGRFGPFSLAARFLRLSAIDRTDDRVAGGKQLPSRPGHELSIDTAVHAGPTRWGFDLTVVGDNYLESGERHLVPDRVLLGLGMRWVLGPVRLDARVHNMTDEEVFDLWDHPLPGRTLSVSIAREVGR